MRDAAAERPAMMGCQTGTRSSAAESGMGERNSGAGYFALARLGLATARGAAPKGWPSFSGDFDGAGAAGGLAASEIEPGGLADREIVLGKDEVETGTGRGSGWRRGASAAGAAGGGRGGWSPEEGISSDIGENGGAAAA